MESYRANLTAAEFPLLSEFQGRTVIVGNYDQNFSRQANSPRNKDRDIGIPQAYYMHNVIPTDAGFTSVGYQTIVNSPADNDNAFTDGSVIRDSNGNVGIFVATSTGRCYVLPSIGTGWLRTTDLSPLTTSDFITIAYVNGQTYIYFGRLGCYQYNFATNVMDAVTLTSLTANTILGITASNGYMIAWTKTTVLRSSTIDPTDFTPSLVTGAGGGGIQEIKADITVCLAQNSGFVIYSKANAVAALFTGNVQYPFNYREIGGSGGLANLNLAAYDGNSTNHYAWTTNGLQEVSLAVATAIFPQLTDFIAGSQFEDFDESTYTFNENMLSAPMVKKFAIIANRYLIVSYGVTTLTHALLYDVALARWGKLKIPHVDCFEYKYPSSDVVDAPKRSIAFLQADGTVKVVTMAYNTTGSSGVLVLGKFQFDRAHHITLQEIHLESVSTGSSLAVKVLTTIDGLNYTQKTTTLAVDNTTYRKYNCRATGLNHSIVLTGAFNANSLVLGYSVTGKPR